MKTLGNLIETGTFDNITARYTSLENMPQLFYRNLEGDNMLATQEFAGRVRAIETPIKLVEINTDYYILKNVPYISDLITNPTNWMFGAKSASGGQGPNYAIKILTAEYIKDYTKDNIVHTNCCKIRINPIRESINTTVSNLIEGESVYLMSFLASGIYLKGLQESTLPAFPASGNANNWNGQVNAVGASWKCSDGTYRALVGGYAANLPAGQRYIMKLFSTRDRMGDWTNLTGDNTISCFNHLIPTGYVGFTQTQQAIKHPYKENNYLMALGLFNSSGNVTKIVILEFDEYFTKTRLINVTLDYSFSLGLSAFGYGISFAYYKGSFLLSFQDGTHLTGKRVILKSKWLDGTYSLHSTMFDFTAQPYLLQHGSLLGESVPNSSLFVFNNELYGFVAGQPKGGFLSSKLEYLLMKYDDSNKEWNIVKGPILIALHGDDNNYPEYTGLSYKESGSYGGWAKSHIGQINLHYVENNKLWIGYCAKGYMLASGGYYHSTVGYIDLKKVIQ